MYAKRRHLSTFSRHKAGQKRTADKPEEKPAKLYLSVIIRDKLLEVLTAPRTKTLAQNRSRSHHGNRETN